MLRRAAAFLILSTLAGATCSSSGAPAPERDAATATTTPTATSAPLARPPRQPLPPAGIPLEVWQRAVDLARNDSGKAGALLMPYYEEAWRKASAADNNMSVATHRARATISSVAFSGHSFRFSFTYKVDWALQSGGDWVALIDPGPKTETHLYNSPARSFSHPLAIIPADGKLLVRSKRDAAARLAVLFPGEKLGELLRPTRNILETTRGRGINLRTGEAVFDQSDAGECLGPCPKPPARGSAQ